MKKRFSTFIKVLGVFMLVLIFVAVIAAIVGLRYISKQKDIPKHAILELKFYDDIPERSTSVSLVNKYFHGQQAQVSMREVSQLLEEAKNDENIEALLIDGNSFISHTKAIELHKALATFSSESEKKIYAYGSNFRQGAYLASCAADSLFLHPMGSIDLKGYSIIFSYFKDFLNRYDLDMEVFRAGKYKSYVESYTRNEASPETRLQYLEIMDNLQAELVSTISTDRNISESDILAILQENGAGRAKNCLQSNLIDALEYDTDFRDRILKPYDEDESGIIDLGQYKNHLSSSDAGETKVAFIAMSGSIGVYDGEISSKFLQKTFSSIRKDEDIKTVLIRMDSGGGSAFASENIWHELELCKEAGKEIIASVSSIAGSGGYYVISNSDKIFANDNSIIGSIGVFIAFPMVKNALEKHVGVHFDEIKTGPFAARIKGINNLTTQQRTFYKASTEELYETFKNRVSVGRKLSREVVDSIAQGRLYSASVAQEIGLVDSLIDLQETFAYIKSKHGNKPLKIIEYHSSEDEFFKDLEIGNLLEVALQSKSELTALTTKSVHEFTQLLNDPTPQAKVDFFHLNY